MAPCKLVGLRMFLGHLGPPYVAEGGRNSMQNSGNDLTDYTVIILETISYAV